MKRTEVNRTYKDRLFRLVFRTPDALLELYNAVNGSAYDRPEDLEITTLEDVIYIGMKNDVSFLVGDVLNLYEQQSSYNPNMPIRGLTYFAKLYQQYISEKQLNVYSSSHLKLPYPQYVVFYNGLKEEPDRLELTLSEAFGEHPGMKPSVEISAIMLNINLGYNRKLMEQCRQLSDYAYFIAEVQRQKEQCADTKKAIKRAVERCIKEGRLAEILSRHRLEVIDMLFTEYDEQSHMASEREEGRVEGITVGKAEGKAESVLELLEDKGDIPDSLRGRIMSQRDLAVLSFWHKLAARVKNIQEFTDSMDQGVQRA